jgi:hypothetical protein
MNPRRPRGSHRSYDPLSHLVFLRSQGEYVWDEQGRKYLDLICGYSACNLGHAHPRLTAAVCEQISEQTWAHGGQSQLRSRLEETLGSLWDQNTPPGRKPHRYSKVWLTVSGARAIEIAWKLAYAKRPGSTIGFYPDTSDSFILRTGTESVYGVGSSNNVVGKYGQLSSTNPLLTNQYNQSIESMVPCQKTSQRITCHGQN